MKTFGLLIWVKVGREGERKCLKRLCGGKKFANSGMSGANVLREECQADIVLLKHLNLGPPNEIDWQQKVRQKQKEVLCQVIHN